MKNTYNYNVVKVGKRIEQLAKREAKDGKVYSKRKLAQKLKVSRPTLDRIFNGESSVTGDVLDELRECYGVPADYILYGIEQDNVKSELLEILENLNPKQMEVALGHVKLVKDKYW